MKKTEKSEKPTMAVATESTRTSLPKPAKSKKKEAAITEPEQEPAAASSQIISDGKVHEIPIDLIHKGANYRKEVDTDNLSELAENIKQFGLLQPISLRNHPAIEGHFEIIAGERRTRACRMAGMQAVKAVILQNVDDRRAKILQVIENLQREEVHPMDEARAFMLLTSKNENGEREYTADQLAETLSKDRSYIFKRMKLSNLCERGEKWFRDGTITYNHALIIARLEPHLQDKALDYLPDQKITDENRADIIIKSTYTLLNFLKNDMAEYMSNAPFSTADDNLIEGVPSCDNCPKRTINIAEEENNNDKCLDKFCFAKKTDANKLNVIDSLTDKQGNKPITGEYDWNSVKIGKDRLKCEKKKSKEFSVPVVITKQQHGKSYIGTVVYIANEKTLEKEKNKFAENQKESNEKREMRAITNNTTNEFGFEAISQMTDHVLVTNDKLEMPLISNDFMIEYLQSRYGYYKHKRAIQYLMFSLTGISEEECNQLFDDLYIYDEEEKETTMLEILTNKSPQLCEALNALTQKQRMALIIIYSAFVLDYPKLLHESFFEKNYDARLAQAINEAIGNLQKETDATPKKKTKQLPDLIADEPK